MGRAKLSLRRYGQTASSLVRNSAGASPPPGWGSGKCKDQESIRSRERIAAVDRAVFLADVTPLQNIRRRRLRNLEVQRCHAPTVKWGAFGDFIIFT